MDVRVEGDDGDGDEERSIPCAWLFLPLPVPIGLPHGYHVQEGEELRTLLSGRVSSGLRMSLKVHQIQRSISPLSMDMAELMIAAAQATAGEKVTGAPLDRADLAGMLPPVDLLPSTLTVIEIAVPHATEHDLALLLDDAIDLIRHVQEGVVFVTQEAMPLLSRAFCPPTIPVYLGTVKADESPSYEEWVPYLVHGSAPTSTYGVDSTTLTAEQMEAFGHALQAVVDRHPFAGFADLRREALDQLQRIGNRRLAIAVLATAAEVFLDTLILLMTWEERTGPYETAATYDVAEGHAHRVAANLPRRLGGNWDPKGTGPVGRYFQDLVYLRHRVVHSGHYPNEDETTAATKAISELEHFIGDRLCHKDVLNHYTRTALMYFGEKGISARGRWTTAVKALADDDTQPNWIGSFARWRHHFDRETNPVPPEPGNAYARCIVYLDRDVHGAARWTVHDPSTCFAAVVDPSDHLDPEAIGRALGALEGIDHGPDRIAVGLAMTKPTGFVVDHEMYDDLTILPGPQYQ